MSTADRMHELLLHVAGRVPDDFLASAREKLANGAVGEVAGSICERLAQDKVSVTIAQAGLLSELVDDGASAVFTGIPIADEAPPSVWLFDGDDMPERTAETTAALIAVLSRNPAALGLWIAWRKPFRGEGQRLPVHVVTVDDSGDQPRLSGELHRALAGHPDVPRIEVVGPEDVPAYQRAARGRGTLAWAATEPGELQVARVFDRVDPERGPEFDRNHPILEQAELNHVLEYLRSGEVLLSTGAVLDDVVEPERGGVVPTSYRGDGTWLWPDAIAYYLEQHGLAPDERLLEHIRDVGNPPARMDAVSTHRALRHLLEPPN
ncbi:hypothetical protein OOZ19_14800 [Saccharopolyspora sp. NFXS83]|uniref:hypothetical protein n=1 Tax=Saccharopolyspora sp. NFXS83 TaxID=2993560 RepID=UPI00224AE081|nr:hypothetical protein [Saccharopolyspora sp. NFXS83]MCX2731512.1 hypothetical protein [Saccharopolyspora sp. NFXS83]